MSFLDKNTQKWLKTLNKKHSSEVGLDIHVWVGSELRKVLTLKLANWTKMGEIIQIRISLRKITNRHFSDFLPVNIPVQTIS